MFSKKSTLGYPAIYTTEKDSYFAIPSESIFDYETNTINYY